MLSRRTFLLSASAVALASPALAEAIQKSARERVRPLPLEAVRLKPSIQADALEANRRYLLELQPDRLLHNFHKSAGLPPKGELYGGWEARGIAGHTLGHYLTACALMYAHTGDTDIQARLRYTVGELARCQAAHGDGYVGGTTVERDGKVLDGKIVFEEIRHGDIRTGGFDINGGWVPLYTWHKVHAGLIDAYRLGRDPRALDVMLGMADYLATILEQLSDAQMQKLLVAEYGGLNDSYAETYALTGNRRYLKLAQRIRDRKVLDPITAGQNILPGLHANTQIPKIIGLARLYELTGEPRHAEAARFVHKTVFGHHTYVIGGNSEREHFGPPDVLSPYITDRTCEACNSYNMLKLTRHLYAWEPDARYFDTFERVHLNHIMAHQHPKTGMFVYFMPLTSGARRTYSTPDDSFWCCVGSGLESHSKHGDSIYWEDGRTLYVNLFTPSTLNWTDKGMAFELDTQYPFSEKVTLLIKRTSGLPLDIALRLPGWCENPAVFLNGKPAAFERARGYALLKRRWKAGDRIELALPMPLRTEATPDNPRLLAFLHGPLVLAADLGPADQPYDQPTPALVSPNPLQTLKPVDAAQHVFRTEGTKPQELTLRPFFNQYDRRTAVYFPIFTQTEWAAEREVFLTAQAEKAALEKRTVDVVFLGEMQPERDHNFRSNHSDLLSWQGHSGRQAWWGEGNYIEVDLAVKPGPMVLRALYWGEEVNKNFDILIDGKRLVNERRQAEPAKKFVAVDYVIPEILTRGKSTIAVRFETRGTDAPVYELRILSAAE